MTEPIDTAAARDISSLNSPDVLLKWIRAMADEIGQLRAEVANFEWAEMLTHQSCAAGKHPDWFIDSEHNIICPWCEKDRLRAKIAKVQKLAYNQPQPPRSGGPRAGSLAQRMPALLARLRDLEESFAEAAENGIAHGMGLAADALENELAEWEAGR